MAILGLYYGEVLTFFQKFLDRRSYPLNNILISRQRLIDNYRYITSASPHTTVAPVLKSNAYGHGIELAGKILDSSFRGNDKEAVPFFCVDSLYEAYLLKKAGIETQILIMGYIDPESLKRKKLSFNFAIWDLDYARVINEHQKGAEVHIFVDTGMHREGVRIEDFEEFLEQLKKMTNLKIVGLMTHLAIADKPNNPLTLEQLKNFKTAQIILKKLNIKTRWQHIGGGIAALTIKNPPCNLIRVGKILYGVEARHPEPFGSEPQGRRLVSGSGSRNKFGMTLKPVLKMTTKIVQIKKISKGDRIGYDGTFIAKIYMKVGVLPIGYNDGIDRRLSNKGFLLVDGVKCKILGKVSMNLTTIDISKVKRPFIGQEVVIFSDNPKDPNSIENAAKVCKTIPYDLMIHLNPSTKRSVV